MERESLKQASSQRESKALIVAAQVKRTLKSEGVTLKKAADELGISAQLLSYHLNGKKFMERKFAENLSERFGFELTFLLTGEGKLTKQQDSKGKVNPADVGLISGKDILLYELLLSSLDKEAVTAALMRIYGVIDSISTLQEERLKIDKQISSSFQELKMLLEHLKK